MRRRPINPVPPATNVVMAFPPEMSARKVRPGFGRAATPEAAAQSSMT
jgi:hypothetical protein